MPADRIVITPIVVVHVDVDQWPGAGLRLGHESRVVNIRRRPLKCGEHVREAGTHPPGPRPTPLHVRTTEGGECAELGSLTPARAQCVFLAVSSWSSCRAARMNSAASTLRALM